MHRESQAWIIKSMASGVLGLVLFRQPEQYALFLIAPNLYIVHVWMARRDNDVVLESLACHYKVPLARCLALR